MGLILASIYIMILIGFCYLFRLYFYTMLPKKKEEKYGITFWLVKYFGVPPFTIGKETFVSQGFADKITPMALRTVLMHENHHQIYHGILQHLRPRKRERDADLYAAKIVGKENFIKSFIELKKKKLIKDGLWHRLIHKTTNQRINFIKRQS